MPSKRKRTNTVSSVKTDAVEAPVAQPSSRDASEEDIEDPVLQEVSSLKQKQSDAMNPPAKRSRSTKPEGEDDEMGDAKAEEQSTPKRNRRSTRTSTKSEKELAIERSEHGENGERGTMGMEPPPPAGLVHPKGYKTNPPPVGRQVRVYADGVFDLFHLGHMRQLQQAKQAFPDVYLIVGVTGDKETHRRKGLTVLSAKERAESVRHCKWVDEVVEDCPWIISDAPEFMEKYKIDYVAHDDIPYGADEGDDIYAPIKAQGKFLVTQRTEGVSTTGIITKIVRDYEKYISRQLKRGTSRQELNISWLKKNELDIKRNMAELKDNIKNNWTTTGQELGAELRKFWQSSRPGSPARTPVTEKSEAASLMSPSALSRLTHLDIPRANGSSSDFAAGYSLGLIGGVRTWMARTRRTLNESRPASPDSAEESSGDRSPNGESSRGRQGKQDSEKMSIKS